MGLMRGMARTAVVAGTATAVSNRVSRRQANKWAAQEAPPEPQYEQAPPPVYQAPPPVYQAPPPAAPPAAAPDRLGELQKLADLKEQGILTEEEFQREKSRILAS